MIDRCPLFVELCAGTAALSLRLHAGRNARPPVSRMGAKTGYADVILRVLGLRPGQGHADGTRYLWCEPDAGVRLLLHAYTDRELATAAADIIRSWEDEEPRALWERLRAEGPARCPEGLTAREVARESWLWARLVAFKGPRAGYMPGDAEDGSGRWVNTPQGIARKWGTAPTLPAAIHPDARKVDPREVARWSALAHGAFRRGFPSSGFRPEAAGREPRATWGGERAYHHTLGAADWVSGLPAAIHADARKVDPPTLPPGSVAYMDPPYRDTTGYAHDLPRAEVVRLARRWADAGALVCISEAEPIAALVADGWHSVEITGERKGQRRTFSKQQREWLTMNRAPAWRPSVQAGLFG